MVDIPFVTALGQFSIVVSQPVSATQLITFSWTGVTVDSPCGSYGYAVEMGTGGQDIGLEQRFSLSTTAASITREVPGFATSFFLNVFTSGYCSAGTLRGVTWVVSTPTGYCQYGTRMTGPATQPVQFVTQTLIDLVLAPVFGGFLAPLFFFLIGTTIDFGILCAQGPGAIEVPSTDWFSFSKEKLLQQFRALAWYSFCECIPGTPPPVPYPTPRLEDPGNFPPVPTFSCDNVDVCATLVQLQKSMMVLQQTVAANVELTTFLQRYGLPFETIAGVVHSDITGTGSFPVPRIVGLLIEVTAGAENHEHLFGTPSYLWDVGWASVTTAAGMIEEKRITRERITWYPKNAQSAHLFGWALSPDITLRVTELYAEP